MENCVLQKRLIFLRKLDRLYISSTKCSSLKILHIQAEGFRYNSNVMANFWCISCNRFSKGILLDDPRENFNCFNCGTTSRNRAVILAVKTIALKRYMSGKKAKTLIGISDSSKVEQSLLNNFHKSYQNYQFHKYPSIDILNVPDSLFNSADIVICSDVLEHVESPVQNAFVGLFSLLKPGGSLIVSVPHNPSGFDHIEHFPVLLFSELIMYPIPKLTGILDDGTRIQFDDLVFHGGDGAVLEYRVFSEDSLRHFLTSVGFESLKPVGNSHFFGVQWEPWSRVWIARKPW
jgi:SAM-dependent methyltransferase